MLTKIGAIKLAQERGSSARTFRGALRFLQTHQPKWKPLVTSNVWDVRNDRASSWNRNRDALERYRTQKIFDRAEKFCRALGLENREARAERLAKRRARHRAKTISPYRDAALSAIPTAGREHMTLWDYAPRKRMALFGVDAWIKYSWSETWHMDCACLVILDSDSGDYNAVRVGPSCVTIAQAVNYLKPAEVRRAETSKKKILRQGDMYFIPQRIWNLNELDRSNHTAWYETGRNGARYRWQQGEKLNGNRVFIVHPSHKTLVLTSPHKVRQQITVFGRSHAHSID